MKTLVLLVLMSHFAFAVKHSLKLITMASTGSSNLPKFFGAALVNDTMMARCDTEVDVSDDWMKIVFENDPKQRQYYAQVCRGNEASYFTENLHNLMQRFNQSGGDHILQTFTGCEWEDETDKWTVLSQHGYDGEDFLSYDPETSTFITPRSQAFSTKLRLETDVGRKNFHLHYLKQIFPDWLKKFVKHGSTTLTRTVLPSLSLLQKSPSSPITCHATGFYPNSAVLFWRKDGEELFDDVEYGEILPNQDGSFQMSVELLKLPSEDWGKYECVFQLSGVKEEIITKLHKNVIRTNYVAPLDVTITVIIIIIIITAVAVVCCLTAAAHKKCKAKRPEPTPQSSTEILRPDDDESTLDDDH